MKQIIITIGSSNIGGAEKQALILAQHLVSDYNVSLVFLGPPNHFLDLAKESGLQMYVSKGTLLSDIMTLVRVLKSSKPDCLINILYRADLLAGILGKTLGIPLIINSARNTSWPNSTLFKRTILRCASFIIPSKIVANSNRAAAWHRSIGYPESKIHVIPNFIDFDTSSDELTEFTSFRNPVRLGIASRAVLGKGHKTLIKAAEILSQMKIEYELWFIGYGINQWQDLQDWLFHKQLPVNIEDGRSDLSDWFSSIDIYCGVSESWESDSNSVLQAVMNNVPIIVTEIASGEYYFPQPPLVPIGDFLSLADAIRKLCETPKEIVKKETATRKTNLIQSRNSSFILNSWKKIIE